MRTNLFLATAAGLVLLLTSCKKDIENSNASLSSQISSNATADATVETTAPVYTSVIANANGNVAGYWQAVPSLYGQTTKKYPLIIFLHGIGELGTSLSRINCCGLPKHLYNKTFPANFNIGGVNSSFVVMAPQFKVRATAADVQSMIDYMKARYRIDASRVYVTGLSLGGGSTWDYSAVYGQSAAAIVPVCGGTAASTTLSQQIASRNLPIWALYSTADQVVPVQWGYDFFKWIDQYNSSYADKTKLTVWTDVDHNATWARAYDPKTRVDGYNIYEWMLLYNRSSATSVLPTEPVAPVVPISSGNVAPLAKAGADQTVPASWNWFPILNATLSTDSDGWIAKFTWTQVSGPNTANLSSPNTGSTKVTGWTTGTYVFRVAVEDNSGAISYDEISIVISGTTTTPPISTEPPTTNPGLSNKPPTPNAGTDQSVPKSWNWLPGLNATLSTDADGWLTKFAWSQTSGPSTATIATPNGGNSKISNLIVGTYVFRVAVSDNGGAISYDDVTITVTNN